jgi:hypothetical protein
VTLIRRAKGTYLFQLGRREKGLLQGVLALYPRIPNAYPRRKSPGLDEASQKLLDDALSEQRAENKKQLHGFLGQSKRFVEHEANWRLSLSVAEVEWLLQILNDVRIGSWVVLGSPEVRLEVINEKTAPHIWAMEMAGSFQMAFLAATEGKGAA